MDMLKTIRKIAISALDLVLGVVLPLDPAIQSAERADISALPRAIWRRDGIVAFFPYRHPIMRASLIELKERANSKIGHMIGKALYEEIIRELERGWKDGERRFKAPIPFDGSIIVIPVPITRAKRRARGWNQCELLLDGFGNAFEVRKDILIKIRETDDQVGKSHKERLESQRGCFAVSSRTAEAIAGRDAIVVDDIVTTGATLSDARRALISAGARRVFAVAVAH